MEKIYLLLSLFIISLSVSAIDVINTSPDNKWPDARTPKEAEDGQAKSIGFYTGGCIVGAKALSLDSDQFQIAYPKRHRYFGHPNLIEFAHYFSHAFDDQYVFFGDLGQPRGGPVRFGHSSHQVGLDVDIYYHLSPTRIEDFQQTSMVSEDGLSLNENWDVRFERLLMRAADHPNVERLMVNAVVKKLFCQKYPNYKNLNKLRPWYFHDTHFHARLKCPKDSPNCRKQAPPPSYAGCGSSLDYWFHEDRLRVWRNRSDKPVSRKVHLPDACGEVLKD